MANDEHKNKNKNIVKEFRDLAEKSKGWIELAVFFVSALIFSSSQNRILSYITVFVGSTAAIWFLWRVTITWRGRSKRILPLTGIFVVLLPSLAWVAINGRADLLKSQGIFFSEAQPGELLVVVSRFDKRGGPDLDPTTRIVERLNQELKSAQVKNARIEIYPLSDDHTTPTIRDEQAALRVGKLYKAVFVIWGWYDDVGFSPHFTIVDDTVSHEEKTRNLGRVNLKIVEVPIEIKNFNLYIRSGISTQMSFFALFTLGQLYFNDGKFESSLNAMKVAESNLNESLGIEGVPPPESLGVFYLKLAYIYALNRETDRANTTFRRAVEFDPKLAHAFVSLKSPSQALISKTPSQILGKNMFGYGIQVRGADIPLC